MVALYRPVALGYGQGADKLMALEYSMKLLKPLCLGLLCGLGSQACWVPGPQGQGGKPIQNAAKPAPTKVPKGAAPKWYGSKEQANAQKKSQQVAYLPPRPPANQSSPIGSNLPVLSSAANYRPFTNHFMSASGWLARDWKGRKSSAALKLDSLGWVRSLTEGQVAVVQVPVKAGDSYELSYRGEGRLKLVGVSGEKETDSHRRVFVASRSLLEVHLERTSPRQPIQNIKIIPLRYSGQSDYPLFNEGFLSKAERFSVLRFKDWGRMDARPQGTWNRRTLPNYAFQGGPNGVALEYMLDLASQLSADAWICLPHLADENYARGFAELAKERLRPESRLYLEYSSELWGGDTSRPAISYAEQEGLRKRLDGDPTVARLMYQSQRTVQLFSAFEKAWGGTAGLVRVMSSQFRTPAVTKLLLKYQNAAASIDALAVAPFIGEDLVTEQNIDQAARGGADWVLTALEGTSLPAAISSVRRIAKVADELEVDLISYSGGPKLQLASNSRNRRVKQARKAFEEAAHHRRVGIVYLALLDTWAARRGRLFLHDALFSPPGDAGVLGALKSQDQPVQKAPKFDALLRFAANRPKWWKESVALRKAEKEAPAVTAVTDLPKLKSEPTAQLTEEPEEEEVKMYTAPWAKWVTLGVGLGVGVFAADRMNNAHQAAASRDSAIEDIMGATDAAALDRAQADVRKFEDERELSQTIGLSAIGVASALAVWAFWQWLDEPPSAPEPEAYQGAAQAGASP